MRSGLPGSATDAGKTARMHPCECRNVTVLAGEAERAIQQASRFIDFPESGRTLVGGLPGPRAIGRRICTFIIRMSLLRVCG